MKKKIIMISSIFILLDQIIKIIVRSSIKFENEIFILPKFLYITNVGNTGGAFSIFSNNTAILILIGIMVLAFIIKFIYNRKLKKIDVIIYGLLIGGIIGNLIDRIILNSVTDYIGLIFGSYYYPVFNLADIGIVVSIMLLIFLEFRGDGNGNSSR